MTPNLAAALDFLRAILSWRLSVFSGQTGQQAPDLPVLQDDAHPFSRFVIDRNLTVDEFVILVTALSPHLQPYLFDEVVQAFLPQGGNLPQLGGIKSSNGNHFLPSGETLHFLLSGTGDLERRIQVQSMLSGNHFFIRERILFLEELRAGEPLADGRLVLDPDYAERFSLGYSTPPRLSTRFPAQRIESELEWSDLVLSDTTRNQLREIEIWIEHHPTLMDDWNMRARLKPGYRALFYGPPGTGKSTAAALLGKFTGYEVFRIDLSATISKYIGETEKNLAAVFDRAENKNWILFFDEADALFGKRTNVRDAHDRYANQEVSYLLQRIEEFNGLCILATNFKNNIDEAFIRRFHSVVYFRIPKPDERLQLWQKTFPAAVSFAPEIDLKLIAQKYEFTGSNIVNIVEYCCLQALAEGSTLISLANLTNGINRELMKENKMI